MKVQEKVKIKSKKSKKKKIIITIVLILILVISVMLISEMLVNNANPKGRIIATKLLEDDNTNIKYTIQIENYNVVSAIKEITYNTEEDAQLEYNKYEIINEYELREFGLELKKKKLILTMPEKQLLQDIEYDETKNITLIKDNGEETEIINQEEIITCLKQQGYTIK